MKNNELDSNSDYYRVCPFCHMEFMADHRRRKFCSDKCGDKYNNRLKELNAAIVPPDIPKVETVISPSDGKITITKQCEDILWNCDIPTEGKRISIKYLINNKFDFGGYISKIKSTKYKDGFSAEYGPFIMSWEDDLSVFVLRKIK